MTAPVTFLPLLPGLRNALSEHIPGTKNTREIATELTRSGVEGAGRDISGQEDEHRAAFLRGARCAALGDRLA